MIAKMSNSKGSGSLCLLFLYFVSIQCSQSNFDVHFQWTHINFTWRSSSAYDRALTQRLYIPENNAIAGIKIYRGNMYFALPRFRPGTPVTLAYLPLENVQRTNPLLRPFPTWEINNNSDCSNFYSIQSMEIDPQGIMWVLDGMRINGNTKCPSRLVLLDLNQAGKVVHTYIFPETVALQDGGFVNDIVIDETDGKYTYISDVSSVDPGLIVYSKQKNKAWKIRDKSMFAEISAANITIDAFTMKTLAPIDGIALTPVQATQERERYVYFSALVGHSLYAISTKILKDEEVCKGDTWRKDVIFVGTKQASSDGMMFDNRGTLYYTLLDLYGIGKWNSQTPFTESTVAYTNRDTIVWPDSFTFDGIGNLFMLADNIHKFSDTSFRLRVTDKKMFHIVKTYTGTQSYLKH